MKTPERGIFRIEGSIVVPHVIVHKQKDVAYEAEQAHIALLEQRSDVAGFLAHINMGDRVIVHTRPRCLKSVPALDQFIENYRVNNVAMFVAPAYRNKGGMSYLFTNLFCEMRKNHIFGLDIIDIANYQLTLKLYDLLQTAGYINTYFLPPVEGEGNYSLVARR